MHVVVVYATVLGMAHPIDAEIPVQIRAELTRQNLTLEDLAERTGVTLRTLQRRLTGQSSLRVDHVAQIATALGLSLSDLTARAEQVVAA